MDRLAAAAHINAEIKLFELHKATEDVEELRYGKLTDAAVLLTPDKNFRKLLKLQ